ncbi:peptidase T [Aminipila butyrica]|uniref:Peptidase T n=1 Tax=Aminipila butyrica TaxID=433296 RepID=A0A858BWV3_9FIRM|nr:peptidase T [Aminipila butyrica]QIB69659.1 peptidase T [Aminipila butyrica]
MKPILERFIQYVKIDTESVEDAGTVPSTKGQFDLANKLAEELKALGAENVKVDQHACVTAKVSSNLEPGKNVPAIGFIAHLDTAPDCSGKDVKPQIFSDYDGGTILINSEKQISISPNTNPELTDYVGHTIVTSDGTTLLGADNKAGIAIIMDMLTHVKADASFRHGDICVAFTPDEEVQGGAELFDIEGFGADFAFTIDGDGLGEFNCETFNAADAHVECAGVCIHPGAAKNKMVNPIVLANEFLSALPRTEAPETTEAREGFYYVYEISGDTDVAKIDLLLRDFDQDSMEKRMAFLKDTAAQINQRWGKDYVTVDIKMQYHNMSDFLKDQEHITETALEAYRQCGLNPRVVAVRGGTDGSTLSRRGLPTPNLFVGGHNYHSVSEFASVEAMEKSRDVVLKILELYAQKA